MELSDVSAQMLTMLLRAGAPIARPELSRRSGLTPPTVAAALRDIVSRGLAVQAGSKKGPVGRTAALFSVSPRAGWVLGIDVGSTQVALVARDLAGGAIVERREVVLERAPSTKGPDPRIMSAVSAAASGVVSAVTGHGPLRAVGVAVPHPVANTLTSDSYISWDGTPVRVGEFVGRLGLDPSVPVLVENNTNCAALAEISRGPAAGVSDFVFLQVGVRIGLGLVIGRRLRRGAAGASGEVSLLPFPFAPIADVGHPAPADDDVRFDLEHYLGSGALLERVEASWEGPNTVPASARELFERSAAGDAQARTWTIRHAADVARLVLAVSAIVDPALVVLGGGVGQNSILAGHVRAIVSRHRPALEITQTTAGENGTAEGAAVLASEHARTLLLGDHYSSALATDRVAVQHTDQGESTNAHPDS